MCDFAPQQIRGLCLFRAHFELAGCRMQDAGRIKIKMDKKRLNNIYDIR